MLPFRLVRLLVLTLAVVLAAGAFAEDPVALIVEGQTAAGLPAGQTVSSISGPAVNHSGGWGFNIIANDGTNALGTIWGNGTGGPGGLMRVEGTFPPYQQNSFESFWGMGGGGSVSYSAISTNIENGATGLDGVWLDDTPVAVEEKGFPHQAGFWWSFGSRPGVTEDGNPYFVGGIADVQGGGTDFRGLFYGPTATPLFMGGDSLPGLPAPLTATASPGFDYRFSAYGTHYICEVDMDTGSSSNDLAMVMDGAGLMIGGQLVQEGSPVPAAAGGLPGENWATFDYVGITETGSYMITGDTSGATTTDEFVLIDGVIVLREGDAIGGLVLSGAMESAFMNDDGDWAAVWDVNLPSGGNVEALIYNGQVVLMEGDYVDTDGDGLPNADSTLDNFTGIASLVVADREADNSVSVYFTADISTPDTPVGASGVVLPKDDADGLDEPFAVEERAVVVIEIGYRLYFGGAVPVMLAEFACEQQADGVHIRWQALGELADADFILRAENGGSARNVPYERVGAGLFTAVDGDASGDEVTYTLLIEESDGRQVVTGEQSLRLETPAAGVALRGVHPNPFNPEAKISFRVASPQHVKLAVYDMGGRLVGILTDQVYPTGDHQVRWNGRDLDGKAVPSGTYLARLSSDRIEQTTKLMLVK